MENNKYTSHIYKGCLIAVSYIFFDTFVFYAHLRNVGWSDFISWSIMVGGVLLSVHFFSKYNKKENSFSSLFAHGFKTTAVATCFIFIYLLAMIYIVDKQRVTDVVLKGIEQAKKNNEINESSIKANMNNALKVARIMMIAGSLMGNLFLGIIGSLLGTVISKKTN